MTKNDIQYLLNKDTPNIFEVSYCSNVLGITTTLNESYLVDNKRRIIEEQLILEGWFDSITKVGGDLKDLMIALKQVVTDPKAVKKWISGLKIGIINKGIDTIKGFLENVVKASENHGLSEVKKLAQKVGTFIVDLKERINTFSGWAGAITLTGIALSINFLFSKVGTLLKSELTDMTKSFLTYEVMKKLEGVFMSSINTGIETVINGFSGIGALVSWAVKAFEGAKFISSTLEPIVSGFNINPNQDIYLGKHKNENMKIVKRLLKESLHIESMLTELSDNLDFSAFKTNDTLQPEIWDTEDRINVEIKDILIRIANDYWESLGLGFDYSDVTMTGSLANFNWSKYSDVDLHIIFDMNELGDNKEMIKDLLDVKTRKWNGDHDITIKGFEVELYLQPEDQPHHSSGVYSLTNDEWVTEPGKQDVRLDKETIRKKYKDIVKTVDDIEKDKDNESIIDRVDKLKDKIKKMRQSGLEEGGEYSVENIVFKLLRRNDIMEKLGDLSSNAYDNEVTIDEIN
jgi:hypothetical protein